MHWIIQENIAYEEKWNQLIRTLEVNSIPYSVHKLVPFSGELIPEAISLKDTIWCVGSLSMHNTCEKNKWSPGVLPLSQNIINEHYEANKHLYLNNDFEVYTIKELEKSFENIIQKFNDDIFIRPEGDTKFINGQVMNKVSLQEWIYKLVTSGDQFNNDIDLNTRLMIASKKKIHNEARFWVVKNKLITYSQYKVGNMIFASHSMTDSKLIWFVEYLLLMNHIDNKKIGNDDETYCMDVCLDSENTPKIVEFNNMNSSGFYDCEIDKLVIALEKAYG